MVDERVSLQKASELAVALVQLPDLRVDLFESGQCELGEDRHMRRQVLPAVEPQSPVVFRPERKAGVGAFVSLPLEPRTRQGEEAEDGEVPFEGVQTQREPADLGAHMREWAIELEKIRQQESPQDRRIVDVTRLVVEVVRDVLHLDLRIAARILGVGLLDHHPQASLRRLKGDLVHAVQQHALEMPEELL